MRRLALLVLLPALLAGCTTLTGKRPSSASTGGGAKEEGSEAPQAIEAIEAGLVDLGGLVRFPARYLVDRQTQTCWFFVAGTVNPMSCCALRRHPKARRLIPWESADSCSAASAEPPAPTPAPALPRGGTL